MHFAVHDFDDGCLLEEGRLPMELIGTPQVFEDAWALRPAEKPIITVQGWTGPAPRWMRAFERNYEFSRQVSVADAVPPLLVTLFEWVQKSIDPRLNGILVN